MKKIILLLSIISYNQLFPNTNVGIDSIITDSIQLDEVIISASRVEEKILLSAITVDKLDAKRLRNQSSLDQYDVIGRMAGVHVNQGSLNFTSINTRGFATISNARFQQLIDGVDNAAPFLNFGIGNMIGISDLDMQSVELVPGASSGLYGPNAFNGLLYIKSKDAYNYEGFSVAAKAGFTQSKSTNINPIGKFEFRIAEVFKNNWAIKINTSIMQGTDWVATNYTTDRISQTYGVGNEDFDGLNLYGDESPITMNTKSAKNSLINILSQKYLSYYGNDIIATQNALSSYLDTIAPFVVKRNGIKEEDLIKDDKARSIKADINIYKKFGANNDNQFSYGYRIGTGNTVFHSGERYIFRNVSQQFHRIELKNSFYNILGYHTATDFGNSNNLTALAALTNEKFMPTSAWAPKYLLNYVDKSIEQALSLHNGSISLLTSEEIEIAKNHAREIANFGIPEPNSYQFDTTVQSISTKFFQRGGAKLKDNSSKSHFEGNINLDSWTKKIVSVQLGGNFVRYNLNTDGTVYNEDPDGDGVAEIIHMNEFGMYLQLKKNLWNNKLLLSSSIRYDKNQNFKGNFTPRFSSRLSLGKDNNHNIRFSIQSGFRNPETIAQYIYFPASSGIILGGTKSNASRYNLYEGNAIKKENWDKFLATKDSSNLVRYDMNYSSPEKLFNIDLGYKALINNKLYFDLGVYFNTYTNYQAQVQVVSLDSTFHKGRLLPGINQVFAGKATRPTAWNAYTNLDGNINSWGCNIQFQYILNNYNFYANYSYIDYSAPSDIPAKDIAFNTPSNRFIVGISGNNIVDIIHFDLAYKWQQSFLWTSSFGSGKISSFGSLDASLSFDTKNKNNQIKINVSNILGTEYTTNYGSPSIGRIFLLSYLYDLKFKH